ncbi:MAG TPA: acireductone synthase [Pyrinomonadaceae bacterium]|nr:acireductone synthase [Pyrinomonadaceae bacterium]
MTTAILLDIEGTTTPISFVHDTLFPYAKARIPGFILDNLGDLKFEIEQLAEERAGDVEYGGEFRPESANSVSDYLKYLIDQDRKSTPLKSIQGMIWKSGYEKGEIVSPVFDDVPPALKRWKAADKTIAIFSSGSILAQQLLFKHTDQGDLTPFISNYFDTNTGPKRESKSYLDIAETLELKPEDILFFSDIQAELDGARLAGIQTSMTTRPGNAPIEGDCTHSIVENFNAVE